MALKKFFLGAVITTAICLCIGGFDQVLAENSDYDNNFGTIAKLHPTASSVYFTLQDGKTGMSPQDGIYFIDRKHKNYKALTDLLYKAAEHRWTVKVRTKQSLDVNGYAKVLDFFVAW